MKIHAMCLIKNECDIIAQCLKAAAEWCDSIYVFDNGSTDGTWETVLALSKDYKQIIPYKQDGCPFRDSLRGEIFNHFRENSSRGDWWCRLDADEFYVDNPRVFLAKIPKKYQVVWSASLQYYFTDKDLERYRQDPSLYADDVPVEQKCRYYTNNWSEVRFFKYHEKLIWDQDGEWSQNSINPYPIRIRLKHFQYRSPQQIQQRLEIRREAIIEGSGKFRHEVSLNWKARMMRDTTLPATPEVLESIAEASRIIESYQLAHKDKYPINKDLMPSPLWEDRVVEASNLDYDAHNGKYSIREDLMPKIEKQQNRLAEEIKKWFMYVCK